MCDREERLGCRGTFIAFHYMHHHHHPAQASAGTTSFEDDPAIEGRGHEIAPLRWFRLEVVVPDKWKEHHGGARRH